MINKIIWIIGIVWIGNIQNGVQAQRRNFIHPGITYTPVSYTHLQALAGYYNDAFEKVAATSPFNEVVMLLAMKKRCV